MKAIAINGSPKMEKGNTAMILDSFLKGMKEAGTITELFYAMQLKVEPCTCNTMYCWYEKPGECCIKDDMELLYPKLREADISRQGKMNVKKLFISFANLPARLDSQKNN